jgi:predicted nicotinamide N-methyase
MPLLPEIRLHLITEACSLWRGTEQDIDALGMPLPFWAFCWPGGQALARHVLDHPELVRGKRVLDFGCGGAVEAIASGLAGASHVLASDLDPFALESTRLNAELNGTSLETTADDLVGHPGDWDVVLAGDVFYEATSVGPTLAWLRGLAQNGARVLIGDPDRGFLPSDREACGLRRSGTYNCGVDGDVSGQLCRETTIWQVVPSLGL